MSTARADRSQSDLVPLRFPAPIGEPPIVPPRPPTSFVGRERDVAAVCDLVRRAEAHGAPRLVTLTGPGGVGKSRLAIRVAEELAADVPGGVWFVPLAAVQDPMLVAPTIARVLTVREVAVRSLQAEIVAFLEERRALLVLDNAKHLLDAAPLVSSLLSTCPSLRIVVTSRAVLRVSGEHVYRVPPLADAARLFVERATAASADFALTPINEPAVAEICRRLDGLPLAIELAAARVAVLPPAALLARLELRLPLLTGGPRDQPARLQTMRDAIAWSYDLLTPEEQALFRRLAVFVDGFTVEAAERVMGAPTVRDGITSLVGQSLLHPSSTGRDVRYTMLETVREFGLEQVAQNGEDAPIRAAHAAWVLALAERAEPELAGPEQAAWVARLDAELGVSSRRAVAAEARRLGLIEEGIADIR